MNKIIVTTDSKFTKRLVLFLQQFVAFKTLSFRIPKRIRSVISTLIYTYYGKAIMTSVMNDLYWYGMSATSTNTEGANITYHIIDPADYSGKQLDMVVLDESPKPTEWLDVVYNGRMVQINGKGKIREKKKSSFKYFDPRGI